MVLPGPPAGPSTSASSIEVWIVPCPVTQHSESGGGLRSYSGCTWMIALTGPLPPEAPPDATCGAFARETSWDRDGTGSGTASFGAARMRARSDPTAMQLAVEGLDMGMALAPAEQAPPQHAPVASLAAVWPNVVHEQPLPQPQASTSTPVTGAPIVVPNGSTRTHTPVTALSSELPTDQPRSVVSGSYAAARTSLNCCVWATWSMRRSKATGMYPGRRTSMR